MTYNEFCEYLYKTYYAKPLSAQANKQDKTIFYLKMELAKIKKRIDELSKNKED